jgi:phosphoglycerate dehydrogenase-like enzyme
MPETITVMITSPLEAEYVERIRAVAPDRVRVLYRPELMPPTRYTADHNGLEGWTRTADQIAQWHALLAEADVLWDFAAGELRGPLELSPRLRWVQTTSAGVGPLVKRLGIADSDVIVTTASGVHSQPLTEFVFAALLYHVKRLADLQRWKAEHHWERFCGGELAGQTMAIIGPGRIGRETARVARVFNMRVHAMANRNHPERARELGVDQVFAREQLHELLADADVVVLCTPHTPDTEDMMGKAEIAAMKQGAVLINIARGAVIDEAAMVAALASGQIAFAALDVFRTEPLPDDSPLWDLPNVLINPHSASTAYSENAKITGIFCRNLEHFLDGRYNEMSPLLDKQRGY